MKVPLERMCYSCRIMIHRDCTGSVQYQGTTGPCMCLNNDHNEDLLADYEPLHPIPELLEGHEFRGPVGWKEVQAAYMQLVGRLDRFNQMIGPEERVHVPFAIQEVLADYIEERKAIESIEGTDGRQ